MKFNEWKLVGLMALPVALISTASKFSRDPHRELRSRIEGRWNASFNYSVLDIRPQSADTVQAVYSRKGEGKLWYSTIRFVDASHIFVEDDGEWSPGIRYKVIFSEADSLMTLDSGTNTLRYSRLSLNSESQ